MPIITEISKKISEQNDLIELLPPSESHQFILPPLAASPGKNNLLIQSEQNELFLGIQFDEAIHQYLKDKNKLHEDDIFSPELAVVIEELSHFFYAYFHASYDQAISQLEMEVQAEIDRFMVLLELFNPHKSTGLTNQLFGFLFHQPQYKNFVEKDTELNLRYKEAHRLGSHASKVLALKNHHSPHEIPELRRSLFRKTGHAKLHADGMFLQ